MDRFRKNYSDYFSIAAVAAVISCLLLMKDNGATAAMRWLAVVLLVCVFMRPFLPKIGFYYPDSGFAVSFTIGIFMIFYMSWLISSTGLVMYSDGVIFASAAILFIAGYFIQKRRRIPYLTHEEFSGILRGFAAFAVIFLLCFYVIGFNPVVDPSTENYMDYGFMQTIYRQKSAIPLDPWFAQNTLNYYYLGQSLSVCLTRLALTTCEYGYNMMLCTFTGLVFMLVYEIIFGAASALLSDKKPGRKLLTPGALSGAAVAAFGANPHWLIFGIINPVIQKIRGITLKSSYWISDPTVYIRTALGDADNGKNEFPAYSVILGDLHAHVINHIFALAALAVLLDMCLTNDDEESKFKKLWPLTLIAILLGYFKGANYWDFAIYFVITGAVIVFTDISRRGFSFETIGRISLKGIYVFAISVIAILPFTLHFVKMESGIALCENHSPIVKLAVLWALPVLIALFLIFLLYRRSSCIVFDRTKKAGMLSLILCTIGLVITPEFIYVIDIYGEADRRFNTMFKLTYEAYTLFAIFAGIACVITLSVASSIAKKINAYSVISAVLIIGSVASSAYFIQAVYRRYGNVFEISNREGISSIEGLYKDTFYEFEMQAYDELMKDEGRVLNIVEMAGNSYTHESSLSVYTGVCTPCGWFVHEWMWHNDAAPIKERSDLVWYFYTCGNEEFCRFFLKTFDIDYIFVGPAEVCKYPVNRNGFWNMGDICVEEVWQNVDLALIKVDKSKL